MIGRAIAGPSPLEYELVTSPERFAALAGEWDELVRAAERPSPFMLHAWLEEWWRHYGGTGELRVHTLRRDGHLVAALAGAVRSRRGLRVLEFVGAPTDFADVLGEADAAGEILRRVTAADHDYAHFRS